MEMGNAADKLFMSTETLEMSNALGGGQKLVNKLNKIADQCLLQSGLWCLLPRLKIAKLIGHGEKAPVKSDGRRTYYCFNIRVLGHNLQLQVPENGVSELNPVWFEILDNN